MGRLKIRQTLQIANQVKVNRKILPLQKALHHHLSRSKNRENQERNRLNLVNLNLLLPDQKKRIPQNLKKMILIRIIVMNLHKDSNKREILLVPGTQKTSRWMVLNKNLKKVRVVKVTHKIQVGLRLDPTQIVKPVQEVTILKLERIKRSKRQILQM